MLHLQRKLKEGAERRFPQLSPIGEKRVDRKRLRFYLFNQNFRLNHYQKFFNFCRQSLCCHQLKKELTIEENINDINILWCRLIFSIRRYCIFAILYVFNPRFLLNIFPKLEIDLFVTIQSWSSKMRETMNTFGWGFVEDWGCCNYGVFFTACSPSWPIDILHLEVRKALEERKKQWEWSDWILKWGEKKNTLSRQLFFNLSKDYNVQIRNFH